MAILKDRFHLSDVYDFRLLICTTLICIVGLFSACTKSNWDEPGDAGKKALLIILDGWGIGDKGQGDAIARTDTPYMDYLTANYPHSNLQASGEFVGLPDGHTPRTRYLSYTLQTAGKQRCRTAFWPTLPLPSSASWAWKNPWK